MTSEVQRLRVRFRKGAPVRWIGHLDVARFWERALRRAELPVVYSQGFHPQPKIQFASALPVGFTGRNEVMDIWFSPPQNPREVHKRLQAQCPPGFEVVDVWEVPLHAPSLQSLVRAAEYEVALEKASLPPDWRERIAAFLAAEAIWREKERKRKKVRYNLRPLILSLEIAGEDEEWVYLHMRVRSEPGATGRPDEVLAALGWEDVPRRIERTAIIFREEDSHPPVVPIPQAEGTPED